MTSEQIWRTIRALSPGNGEALKEASFPRQSSLIRQDRSALISSITIPCKRALWALCKLSAVSTPMRVVVIGFAFVAVCCVVNLVYQMLHKPTEVFAPISSEFNKAPIETWRQYAPLFREYSTVSIPPELLAALAQVESAGNPVATTYWRWRLTGDPFAIYQPASSAVGMYQMTDAAFAEAEGYCRRTHRQATSGRRASSNRLLSGATKGLRSRAAILRQSVVAPGALTGRIKPARCPPISMPVRAPI